jgi:FkbM family methyltransferase
MEFKRWFADKGDATHRMNYPLQPSSLVLDVGGYRGDFAEAINRRYGCTVYIFEPVESFYESIKDRFKSNENITVFNYGLSSKEELQEISLEGDASSIFKTGNQTESIRLRSAVEVFEELNINNVDLIKINIEGGEFPLMDHLIESSLVNRLRDIQVQFHSFVDDAIIKRHNIRQSLKQTHLLTYDYAFVWENWERK